MLWKNRYIFLAVLFFLCSLAYAQNADDIKSKIDERNNQIKQLEAEIQQYNTEVEKIGGEAKTLQNTIKTLDLTKKKITTDITLTEKKITKTNTTINQLDSEIDETEEHLDINKAAVISALRGMQAIDNIGLVQMILSKDSVGDMWTDVDNLKQVKAVIKEKSDELVVLKKEIENKQNTLKGQKTSLVNLRQDLNGKKQVVQQTAEEKATILAQTKNKEQAFKDLVKAREDLKAQFEKDIFEYESQLNITVDTSGYPRPQKGILAWPLESLFVTQKFGKTVGAEKLYVSGSHNGVDFRASVGTRVNNVLSGVVVGTGNTDAYKGCYSFGKWVMVKHSNGLSTIYAHLSVISVFSGQNLQTGELVGYSGNTGYSTGPHLHISVYATQGVRIEKFTNSRGCKSATMPLADVKAYLDPLAYFPSI